MYVYNIYVVDFKGVPLQYDEPSAVSEYFIASTATAVYEKFFTWR